MQIIEIKNKYYYTKCSYYMKSSAKWIKSMRIANYILSSVFPGYVFSHCQSMFPNYDSNFIVIKKWGINIVAEKSTLHENKVYFSFFI